MYWDSNSPSVISALFRVYLCWGQNGPRCILLVGYSLLLGMICCQVPENIYLHKVNELYLFLSTEMSTLFRLRGIILALASEWSTEIDSPVILYPNCIHGVSGTAVCNWRLSNSVLMVIRDSCKLLNVCGEVQERAVYTKHWLEDCLLIRQQTSPEL